MTNPLGGASVTLAVFWPTYLLSLISNTDRIPVTVTPSLKVTHIHTHTERVSCALEMWCGTALADRVSAPGGSAVASMRPLPVVWVASYRLTDLQIYNRTLETGHWRLETGDCCARTRRVGVGVSYLRPRLKTRDSRLTPVQGHTIDAEVRGARCEVRGARCEMRGLRSHEVTKLRSQEVRKARSQTG